MVYNILQQISNPNPERNLITTQTFGAFLGFKSYSHIPVTDSCFYVMDMFRIAPPLELKSRKYYFSKKVFRMILAESKENR